MNRPATHYANPSVRATGPQTAHSSGLLDSRQPSCLIEVPLRLIGLAAVVAMTFALGACFSDPKPVTDPKQVRVTLANEDQLEDLRGLTAEELRLLRAFLMRRKVGFGFPEQPPTIDGKTVGDVIAEQRELEADIEKIREEFKRTYEPLRKQEALASELRTAIYLGVSAKRYEPSSNALMIECRYENASRRHIRSFTGILQFRDSFDKPIFQSRLTIPNPIRAGETAMWAGPIDTTQVVASQTDRIVWRTLYIIYADGTQVGTED